MLEGKLRPLSDFEWASVGQYMVYISSAANLEEINSNDVISFPLILIGADKVVRRKTKVLAKLELNLRRLEAFVGRYDGDLDAAEKSVLRTLYIQTKRSVETVGEHIKTAEMYRQEKQASPIREEKVAQDEFPF